MKNYILVFRGKDASFFLDTKEMTLMKVYHSRKSSQVKYIVLSIVGLYLPKLLSPIYHMIASPISNILVLVLVCFFSKICASLFLSSVYDFRNPKSVFFMKNDLKNKIEIGKSQQKTELKFAVIAVLIWIVLCAIFLINSSLNIAMLVFLVSIIVWIHVLINPRKYKNKLTEFEEGL